MSLSKWIGTSAVLSIVAIGGCSSNTSEGAASSTSATASSGTGGTGAGGMSSTGSSSGSGGSGGVGGAFGACADTTGSLKDCKNCCDCASQLSCDDQRACRDVCNALGDAYFTMNQNPMPVVVPSDLGPSGDYSACSGTTTTEQECKACCDCSTNFVCGDHQFCRNQCIATFGDGGTPPPPPDGG